MTNTNEKALAAFIENIAGIQEHLEQLQNYVDNHMEYNPDEINWGHVGTAAHYLASLKQLTDQAYGRGEYANK
jgi:hypothetical protein